MKVILQEGEGYNVEYKRTFPSKLSEIATELCAFANASGGVLLIGVDDKNNIFGVKTDNAQRSKIQNVLNLIEPKIDIRVSEQIIENKTLF